MPQLVIMYTIIEINAHNNRILFVSGEVLRELLAHLRRTRFPVDIGSLARIEEMIADDKFGAPNFDSLGNGSFLAFLASHDEACEALGGKFIGTNLSPSHISSVKQKVLSIVHQLKFDKRDDQVRVAIIL